MRESKIERRTAETDISLTLELDGSGKSRIDTGIGFLDHMLTLFASHGRFDLDVFCRGDLCTGDSSSDVETRFGNADNFLQLRCNVIVVSIFAGQQSGLDS